MTVWLYFQKWFEVLSWLFDSHPYLILIEFVEIVTQLLEVIFIFYLVCWMTDALIYESIQYLIENVFSFFNDELTLFAFWLCRLWQIEVVLKWWLSWIGWFDNALVIGRYVNFIEHDALIHAHVLYPTRKIGKNDKKITKTKND